MGEVKLLNFKYMLGAATIGGKSNDYSGSLSINPEHHSVFDDEFRYKASVKKTDDGKYMICAQYYVGNKCFDKTDPSIIKAKEFDGSDEGIAQAKEWLQKAYESIVTEQ